MSTVTAVTKPEKSSSKTKTPLGKSSELSRTEAKTRDDLEFFNLISKIYNEVLKQRNAFKKQFNSVKESYIVEGIFNTVIEDALSPDVLTGDILELGSNNEKIDKQLKELHKRFDFDILIDDIILDLVSYGEYTTKMVVHKGEGVVELKDTVEQDLVVPIYDQGFPIKYVCLEQNKLVLREPVEFVHFILGRNKIKISLRNFKISKETYDKYGVYPNNVRIGRPLLYGVIEKIKELALLESLVPATKISQLSTGSIISVQVPPTMVPEDAFNAVKRYEQILNQRVGVDRANGGLFTAADILTTYGKIKAIPQYGDKGSLQTVDVKDNRNVDDLLNSIQNVRQIITTSMGIPAEIIFGGETNKSDLLKRYARYLRKIKAIQTSIRNGLTQMAVAHLVNSGFPNVLPSDIQIRFKNESINIDELEKLEYVDASVTQLNDIVNFVGNVNNNPSLVQFVDYPALATELKKLLLNVGSINNMIDDKAKYVPPGTEPPASYYDQPPTEPPPEDTEEDPEPADEPDDTEDDTSKLV